MADVTQINLDAVGVIRDALDGAECIGIDTEFMRERTFYSQLCLLQLAAGSYIYCIDPLNAQAGADVADAWQLLLAVPWVLHSGRQDIEVVYQTAGAMPANVFDTQIAAGLLGYQPQIGYANLVADLFDVQLAKSHTRANWSKRPLAAELIDYAAEDVLYLLPACRLLQEKLDDLGRLEWARQDSADLLNKQLYDINPDLAADKLKGARNFRGAARNVAVSLASWREKQAHRSNRPRQWIMPDKVLLEIASRQPATTADLAAVTGISGRTVERAGSALLRAVESGRSDDSGSYEPPSRPDEMQKALLNRLQQRVSACASELGIAAEIIAPKKELSAAIGGDIESRVFGGWRAGIIGNDLRELIESQ